MSDLIAIAEGKVITSDEARNRVMTIAKKSDLDPNELVQRMENYGAFSKPQIAVADLKKTYNAAVTKMGGNKKRINTGKSSGNDDLETLVQQVKSAGMEEEVLAAMNELGLGKDEGLLGKAIGAAKGVGKGVAAGAKTAGKFAKAVVGEDVINEEEVSDELVRTFFQKLITTFEKTEANEGLRESVVDDFLNAQLDHSGLRSILTIIDDNNSNGVFNAVKDSIVSKWKDSNIDTSTMRSISDELISLSKKGIDI